ncbi:MAG: MotA/TolQ/ExbB proton channel family protein [Candidatus Omnitrophota bacterium]
MVQFFLKGGLLMWPILICSIIALTIIFERTFHFRRAGIRTNGLIEKVIKMVKEGELEKALEYTEKQRGAVAYILSLCLRERSLPKKERDEIISLGGSRELRRLEKNVRTLGIIAHVTPLLGLLGTVTGMIRAFMKIQDLGGHVDASVLAGGIWEALITTAFGLAVAIPAMIAYHYFDERIDDISSRMKEAVQSIFGVKGVFGHDTTAGEGTIDEGVDYGV